MIEQEGQPEESMKERGMKVILDSLQSDESKLQKKLILQKSKGDSQLLDSNQRRW